MHGVWQTGHGYQSYSGILLLKRRARVGKNYHVGLVKARR